MTQARKILIADPDLEAARALSKALRQRGFQVHYAPDGARALEVAVLRHPDITLFDDACQMLDAKTFMQILRTNPRTEQLPVVLTSADLDPDSMRGLRDGSLRKPYNVDEVLARIEHIVRRNEAAKELTGESKEIEGSLTQLSIADLLQILAMNRRSGRLQIVHGNERGEVFVGDGRPLNAKVGPVEGEKALFRLLGWAEGNFSFFPAPPTAKVRINRGMDDALLEGMRHADEVMRFLPSLPPRTARMQLAPDASLPGDQHPVTAQVVELLRQPRTVAEILDLAPALDLEVLGVLATLMQKGVARISQTEPTPEGQGPLLGPAEIHALRARLFGGRAPNRPVVAKVFVLGAGAAAGRRVLTDLPGVVAVSADSPALRSGFGTLGRFGVGEGLEVDFCLLPTAEAARPLWRPFCAGAVGAMLMDVSEPALKLAHYLGWQIRVPLVVLGEEVPAALRGAPAGSAAVGHEPRDALRNVLVQSLQTPDWTG